MKLQYPLLVGLLCPSLVVAKTIEPASIDLAQGLKLTPTVAVTLGFDDNTTHDPDATDDSAFMVIAPKLKLGGGNEVTTEYFVSYEVADGTYFSTDEDDYTDHTVEVFGRHEFTRRHRASLGYDYRREHTARGEGITEGRGPEVDSVAERDIHQVVATYGFGAPSAQFNIEAELGYLDREYANFRERGQYRDYDRVFGAGTLYWNLAPRTSALFEWRHEEQGYDRTAPGEAERDSTDDKLLVGMRWEASYKTTGIAKLGYEKRDFDASEREDFDGFTGLLGMEWKPRSYSLVAVNASYEARDPDTLGDYVEEGLFDVAWKYAFNQRFYTQLDALLRYESYTGIDRDDDAWRLGAKGVYLWRRWFQAELGYYYEEQNSDFSELEYDNNLVFLTVTLSL